jgi:hypothetical protein
MYREAWHTERDWFYDRNIHGLDLKAAEKEYELPITALCAATPWL